MSGPWQLVSERPGGSVACVSVHDHEVLAVSAAAVHQSVNDGASWSTLSAAQPPAPLYAVTRTDRSLFVGGASGLFRSRDEGRSWRQVLAGAAVTSLAVGTDQTLIAGTDSDGILRSDDDGDAWASGNPGLLDLNVLALAVCEGAMVAGTASGVYRSVNGGLSWREIQLPCGPAACECLTGVGRVVLAGTDSAGAFVSADAGRTWSAVDGCEAAITAVALGTDSRMAIGAPGGVYLSGDGGQTWRREATPDVVLSLAFAGLHLLAGVAHTGVLRFDAGESMWLESSNGLKGRVIVDLVRTPTGALLTASIEDGIQRSIDNGRTWRAVAGCAGSVSRLAVGGERVYAASTDGLYWSADDGGSWSVVRSDAAAIAVATGSGGLTVAAFEDEQLLVRRDDAWLSSAWDRDRGRIVSLAVSADGATFVGCLAEQPLVWRSSDAGRSWSVWLRCVGGASLSLASGDEVLAASGTRIYRLLGATSVPDPVTSITIGAPHRVYVGTTHGVFISLDGAQHFSTWSDGLPVVPVLALHASADYVYALHFGGTVWRRAL